MSKSKSKNQNFHKIVFILSIIALVLTLVVSIIDICKTIANLPNFSDPYAGKAVLNIDRIDLIFDAVMLSVVIGLFASLLILDDFIFNFRALALLVASLFLFPGLNDLAISGFMISDEKTFWITLGTGIGFTIIGLIILISALAMNKKSLHVVHEIVEVSHILHIIMLLIEIVIYSFDISKQNQISFEVIAPLTINILFLLVAVFMFFYLSFFKKTAIHHSHKIVVERTHK